MTVKQTWPIDFLITIIMFGALFFAVSGCEMKSRPSTPDSEKATIVEIQEDPPATIVEFEDGSRRVREGHWGEVGDKITAMRGTYTHINNNSRHLEDYKSWSSPPIPWD